MSDTVTAALISLVSAVIVAVIGLVGNVAINRKGKKEKAAEDAAYRARLEMRMDAIEHKLDIHNGYAEKLGGIRTDIAVIKERIKNMKEDIQ